MKILKRIKSFIFHQAIWITVLSALTFIIPTLIDVYLRKNYEFPLERRYLLDIGFSLLIISLNLLIAKKWLSFTQVGLRRKGFVRALLYSLVFVVLLRILFYFGSKEVFPKELWDKQFLLYLSTFIFLAFQEELMFRGIIFKVWERWKGFLVALFISSILFGLEHLVYPALGFEQITTGRAIRTALWGPTFGLIVYLTGNIWGLSISHFLYNASLSATEQVIQPTEEKISFYVLSFGLFIFLPIIIDKFDQKLLKIKKSRIVWSRYLATLLVIFFLIILGYGITDDLGVTGTEEFCPVIENEEVKACVEKARTTSEACNIDLMLDEAKEEVRGNEKALELLEKNCLWLLAAQFHDLTGDGNEELVMVTSGAGCASCHWNRLFILKEDQVIFEKETEDVMFWPTEEYYGFRIMYPLRRVSEPYCCPTEGIVESYQIWEEGGYKYFHKFDERVEKYEF